MLAALVERPGRVLSRGELASAGGAMDPADPTSGECAMKLHVMNIRRKLGASVVETVRGWATVCRAISSSLSAKVFLLTAALLAAGRLPRPLRRRGSRAAERLPRPLRRPRANGRLTERGPWANGHASPSGSHGRPRPPNPMERWCHSVSQARAALPCAQEGQDPHAPRTALRRRRPRPHELVDQGSRTDGPAERPPGARRYVHRRARLLQRRQLGLLERGHGLACAPG